MPDETETQAGILRADPTAALDARFGTAESIVLRYRNACRFAADEAHDARVRELLERTSIREGLRIVALAPYREVDIDVLDATSFMQTHTIKSIDGCVTTAQCLARGDRAVV